MAELRLGRTVEQSLFLVPVKQVSPRTVREGERLSVMPGAGTPRVDEGEGPQSAADTALTLRVGGGGRTVHIPGAVSSERRTPGLLVLPEQGTNASSP